MLTLQPLPLQLHAWARAGGGYCCQEGDPALALEFYSAYATFVTNAGLRAGTALLSPATAAGPAPQMPAPPPTGGMGGNGGAAERHVAPYPLQVRITSCRDMLEVGREDDVIGHEKNVMRAWLDYAVSGFDLHLRCASRSCPRMPWGRADKVVHLTQNPIYRSLPCWMSYCCGRQGSSWGRWAGRGAALVAAMKPAGRDAAELAHCQEGQQGRAALMWPLNVSNGGSGAATALLLVAKLHACMGLASLGWRQLPARPRLTVDSLRCPPTHPCYPPV
jgi:hypothetical protein